MCLYASRSVDEAIVANEKSHSLYFTLPYTLPCCCSAICRLQVVLHLTAFQTSQLADYPAPLRSRGHSDAQEDWPLPLKSAKPEPATVVDEHHIHLYWL